MVASTADLACGARHRLRQLGREQPQLGVGQRSGLLHGGERLDQRRKLAQRDAGDGKVLHRAQRLDAVEGVSRDGLLTQRIAFGASGHGK